MIDVAGSVSKINVQMNGLGGKAGSERDAAEKE
jgi:hypothetical protein